MPRPLHAWQLLLGGDVHRWHQAALPHLQDDVHGVDRSPRHHLGGALGLSGERVRDAEALKGSIIAL